MTNIAEMYINDVPKELVFLFLLDFQARAFVELIYFSIAEIVLNLLFFYTVSIKSSNNLHIIGIF